ncbi:hypothetical protein R1flu_020646 [Riccia fluitans]|uniref:Uncharacterized protein n=1 Tax=Riccia fluitans TaxID=41844 RepID=A0ABD1ZMB3_9MARC
MSGGSHSPNLELLDQEASMENINRLVEALEMEARESKMSKCKKLFSDEPSNSSLQPTRSNIDTTSEYIMDLSAVGLRKLVDFLVKGECHRIVPPFEVEVEFLIRIGRKYKKDAWQDIAPWLGSSLTHSQLRSEGWLVDDFKKFSLKGHPDGYALDKQVRLVINQVQRMVGKTNRSFCSTTLVLLVVAHVDPRMANYRPDWHMWVSSKIRGRLGQGSNDKFSRGKFREGWAEWDSEKGELVCEREALKEELNKAKEMPTEAKQHTEAV